MADIAINPVTRRVQFTGNTGTGPFAFTFNILADADIAVYKNTTLLTLTTHYTVTTNANGTGSITLDAGQALISSDVLTIIGGRDLSRTTDFVTAGDLLASSLNEQLDSLVIMTQQLDEKVGRTIKTNPGDVYTDLELPTKDNRKGTVLGFNATSGDPEVGPTIADVSSLASITADIATLADIEDGTDATDAIQTVAGISSNVSTVAGISSNVTTVAGNTSNINAVAADATDIGTVAGSISNVNTVAGIDSNITTVAGNTTNINTVAGISSNVTTVAGISANVTTVAGISSNVTTVAGISSDVTTVAADGTDIGTVATNIADVNTVASNIATISAKVSKSGDTMTGDLTIQGNLTVSGTTITVDSATAQTIDLGDGDRMRFGDSNDAYIEWNGTYFDFRSTGRFDLLSSGNDLRLSTGTNIGLIVNHTGGTPAVQLYNSGVQRLATTSTGIDVTGRITTDAITEDTSGNVGIGTSSPVSNTPLTLEGPSGYTDTLWLKSVGTNIDSRINIAPTGTGNAQINNSTGTSIEFQTSGTERLRITSAGSVGIGTSSPSNKLDIKGTVGFEATNSTNEWLAYTYTDNTFRLNYNGAGADELVLDSSGNVAIGATPLTYSSSYRALQFGGNGNIIAENTTGAFNSLVISQNAHYDTDNSWEYISTAAASNYYQNGGQHVWRYAASGTAGNDISWSEAMRISSTGSVGIGTSDPATLGGGSKLTVNQAADGNIVFARGGGTRQIQLGTTSTTAYINEDNASGGLAFHINGSEKARLDNSGNFGIGTSSPSYAVDTLSSGAIVAQFKRDAAGGASGGIRFGNNDKQFTLYGDSSNGLSIYDGATERMRLDNSGNLNLVSSGSSLIDLNFTDSSVNNYARIVGGKSGSGVGELRFSTYSGGLSEAMRLTSGGNLLVGVTSSSANMAGVEIAGNGQLYASTSSSSGHFFNRQSTDGDIVSFRKDGTTVGSIGTGSGDLIVGNGSVGIRFNDSISSFVPRTTSDGVSDGAIDLGFSSARFRNLYLSGGVYLGGTGSANKLDDYEEGTWTPTVSGTSTAGTASYSIQLATYTKIGRLVYWSARVGYTGHTGAGNMTITGLPFTSANRYASAEYSYRDGLTVPASEDLKVYVPPSVSYVGFYSVALGTDAVAALALDTNVTDVSISGVYETT